MSAQDCVCGHDREMHDHHRAGYDCGTCGREVCPSYRSARWRVLRDRLRSVFA